MATDTSAAPVVNQPWNRVVWPDTPAASWPTVWDAKTAMHVPSVGRAVGVITGMAKQCPMDAWRGIEPLPRPRLLERPDPHHARSWFVQVSWEDYLLNGNALAYVTSWNAEGWPASVSWLPAAWVDVGMDPDRPFTPTYYSRGRELDPRRVIHVQRGADRWWPTVGVGVVEQYLDTLNRAKAEEAYESDTLRGGSVPSVAVITPNPDLSKTEADEAKASWLETYAGPGRVPAILPNGTQVIPLAWSPTDAQLVESRKMTLQDVANAFNLDGYWLGAPTTSLTYRSPGPLYLNLLRVTVEPILADFEDVWSAELLPRGQNLHFDRQAVLRDDLQTSVATMSQAVTTTDASGQPLLTVEEARAYLALPVALKANVGPSMLSPVDTTEEVQ